jgi:hypothetical protein
MTLSLIPELRDRLLSKDYEAKSTSYAGLRPGDLIQFIYAGVTRYGFILGSDYKPTGIIYSTRGKSLNYVMVTDSLGDDEFNYLLNNIYGDELKARYDRLKEDGFVGTVSNFRTMQLLGITSIIKILIVPEDE